MMAELPLAATLSSARYVTHERGEPLLRINTLLGTRWAPKLGHLGTSAPELRHLGT
jgi:hypothetical protein